VIAHVGPNSREQAQQQQETSSEKSPNELPASFSMRLEPKFLAQLFKPLSHREFSRSIYIHNPIARPLTGQYDANRYRRTLSKLRPKIAPFRPRSPQRQSKIG